MAGTDRRRLAASGGPAIILVEPQLGENIGTAARAMYNCGLTELRLVRPRDGWPNKKAIAAASGADLVLERARLFDRLEDAIADLRHVYASTARDRYMVKRILTPRRAAAEMRAFMAAREPCGIVFGPERTGLVNDQIALADTVLTVPLNPAFSSLNLAQAVLVVGYEWFASGDDTPAEMLVTGRSKAATKEELLRFFGHFEEELDRSGFLRTRDKRPGMIRNLRNLFQRAQCTAQELRTLHGVITAFVGPRDRERKRAAAKRSSVLRQAQDEEVLRMASIGDAAKKTPHPERPPRADSRRTRSEDAVPRRR
jgi:tRNA/rRNA methyltransferase